MKIILRIKILAGFFKNALFFELIIRKYEAKILNSIKKMRFNKIRLIVDSEEVITLIKHLIRILLIPKICSKMKPAKKIWKYPN